MFIVETLINFYKFCRFGFFFAFEIIITVLSSSQNLSYCRLKTHIDMSYHNRILSSKALTLSQLLVCHKFTIKQITLIILSPYA